MKTMNVPGLPTASNLAAEQKLFGFSTSCQARLFPMSHMMGMDVTTRTDEDLNNLTSPGFYCLTSTNVNLPNAPTFRNVLMVVSYGTNSGSITQVLFAHHQTAGVYIRHNLHNVGWTDWKRVVTESLT